MMLLGRPYTDENQWVDDSLIDDLSEEDKTKVLNWIKENITPRKTPYKYATSYSLKHNLERDLGIYMTNNQFKDAMLECGFYPVDPDELNWHYGISAKSLVFKR